MSPRAARARGGWALLAAALACALAASCAPAPPIGTAVPPAQPGAPPVTHPGAPAPPPATPSPRARLDVEPRIDVGLAADLDSVVVRPAGAGLALRLTGAGGDRRVGSCDGPVAVRRGDGGWSIAWGDSGRAPGAVALAPTDTLWLDAARGGEAAARLRWNQHVWRGVGKVFVSPRGRLTIALHLPLETYLLGVVPGEIGGLTPGLLQAGRAQAIAARSYTLFYLGRRGSEGFDLYGTVEDQVYGPTDSERDLASQCVRGTAGTLALYNGQPIRANYYSTCGGITADVWEAWPTSPLGYLKSSRDRGPAGDYCASSPQYRWREVWTVDEFLGNVTKFAPTFGIAFPEGGLGDLVDVVADSRSRSGRVWQLIVRGSNGEVRVPAYVIRQVVRRGGNPNAILRSNLFKVDVRRDPATRRAISVVASGAGSGHGVGMCQTGALGMARAGRVGEDILRHYYPGIELKRTY